MERVALPDRYPKIAKEWDTERNGRSAETSSISSKDWVWWRCLRKPSHEWQQPVYKRVRGLGCPKCQIEDKSLSKLFPELAREWHKQLNGDIGPGDVAARGRHYAWWQCSKNKIHSWQAPVCNRTSKRMTDCPYCAGKKVDDSNSIGACRRDLVKEWHPKKNTLQPDEVGCGSQKKIWWQCRRDKKHVWETVAKERSGQNDAGCPFCSRRYVCDENRLSIVAPEIAAEWHPSKNRIVRTDTSHGTFERTLNNFIAPHERAKLNGKRLKASDVAANSKEVVWWKCRAKGHEWRARIASRAAAGQGCPYCSGRRTIPNETSLAARYPSVAKQWHPSRNKPLEPKDVAPMTDRLVWWQCHRSADHVWKVEVSKIVKAFKSGHTGCPFCANRRVCKSNSLAAKFPKEVKQLWHPTRNGEIKPTQITAGTVQVVWWKCPGGEGHEWKREVLTITKAWKNGNRGCPFCIGRRLAPGESLAVKFPELLKYWDSGRNRPLKPSKVGCRGYRLIWWRCAKLHRWQEAVGYVVKRFKDSRIVCPVCRTEKKSQRQAQ